jgi:hypothetical protein
LPIIEVDQITDVAPTSGPVPHNRPCDQRYDTMADEGWSGIFDDPIPLPYGGGLRTLRDVGNSHAPDPRQHGVAAMLGEPSTSILRQPALPGSIRSRLGFSSSKANRSAGASFISSSCKSTSMHPSRPIATPFAWTKEKG